MLAVLSVVGYVAIDLASNRTPITILISYLTFNVDTAWARIRVWEYGTAEVWRHPLFGIGLNDWQRGWGLSSSVDNFWLATTMRSGIPAFLLLAAGLVANLARILGSVLPTEAARYRTGYVVTAMAILMTLCTVHMWGTVSVFLMFYFGAGMWFVNGATEHTAVISPAPRRRTLERRTPEPSHTLSNDLRPKPGRYSPFAGSAAGRVGRLEESAPLARKPQPTDDVEDADGEYCDGP
jgi:O-antigen ligase